MDKNTQETKNTLQRRRSPNNDRLDFDLNFKRNEHLNVTPLKLMHREKFSPLQLKTVSLKDCVTLKLNEPYTSQRKAQL